ncbi:hypothetical protein [Providencia alcalifaciens]|uniref:hypothetical protein n=1 Tax=Providencia alcalifaciens TaxID=126385 RepID=UPI0006878E78|nr:hypothetical protein [Providencia alcalifaciens]
MRILILLVTVLTLMGCGNPTPKVTPNNLPSAIAGEEYNTVINISGGYISEKSISFDIIPSNSGLSWSPMISYRNSLGKVQKDVDFHTITVSGTPLKKGVIQIKISGFTYGTMYAGKEFHKTYEIKVD